MADVLELPLSGGAKLKFKTAIQFKGWLQEAREHAKWFLDSGEGTPHCVAMGRQYVRELLELLDGAAQGQPEQWVSSTLSICRDRFPFGFPLAPSNPIVAGLQKLYHDDLTAQVRAVGAYFYSERLLRHSSIELQQIAHPVCLQAIGYAGAARVRLTDGSAAAAEAMVARAVDEVAEVVRVNELALASANNQLRTEIEGAAERLGQDRETHAEGISEAIARIDSTKAAYEEVMRLKAPVDYWAEKGASHSSNVQTYRRWLTGLSLGFLPILAAVYGLGWWALDVYSTKHPASSLGITIYVAGFVGAITAVGLWFIRIVVRLYMSQHHLAADAEERASLLRTYLALTLSGQVSDAERSLVLAAIFRPVPDGLVKDDGAPALTPITALLGLLDKK